MLEARLNWKTVRTVWREGRLVGFSAPLLDIVRKNIVLILWRYFIAVEIYLIEKQKSNPASEGDGVSTPLQSFTYADLRFTALSLKTNITRPAWNNRLTLILDGAFALSTSFYT